MLYDKRMWSIPKKDVGKVLRSDPDFDYPIFMASAEFVGYEPSGRPIVEDDEQTDLDLILDDFDQQWLDFEPFRRPLRIRVDPLRREVGHPSGTDDPGTQRGLKKIFDYCFSETEDRLDPPFDHFRDRAKSVLASLQPLGKRIDPAGPERRPNPKWKRSLTPNTRSSPCRVTAS